MCHAHLSWARGWKLPTSSGHKSHKSAAAKNVLDFATATTTDVTRTKHITQMCGRGRCFAGNPRPRPFHKVLTQRLTETAWPDWLSECEIDWQCWRAFRVAGIFQGGWRTGGQHNIRAANQNQHNCNGNDKYVRCFSKNQVKARKGGKVEGVNTLKELYETVFFRKNIF